MNPAKKRREKEREKKRYHRKRENGCCVKAENSDTSVVNLLSVNEEVTCKLHESHITIWLIETFS